MAETPPSAPGAGREDVSLPLLIAEAVALAGGNLCASGHEWEPVGGRPCPRCDDSEPVYQCARCGEYDFGEQARKDCEIYCRSLP